MNKILSNGDNRAAAGFDFRSKFPGQHWQWSYAKMGTSQRRHSDRPNSGNVGRCFDHNFQGRRVPRRQDDRKFQAEMVSLTGHEDAIFTLSGTMSNQLGLRTLFMRPPHSVLTDSRGHIIHYEAGGLARLTGVSLQPVVASNGKYLTLEDIQAKAILDEHVQYSPTRAISLENTLNGLIMPLEEVRRISAWARQIGLKMHLDGTRL